MSAVDRRLTRGGEVQGEAHGGQQQEWTPFWPGADARTEATTDAIVEEVIADLDQRSVADYLEGHRSESQGQ